MSEQHNVVLLTFPDAAGWRPAFDEAQHLPGLRQAAALERSADGLLEVRDTFTRGAGVATVGSGVLGGLVGLLGGPVGVVLGFAAGAALGSAAEESRATEGGAGLIVLSPRVPDGGAMLVLEVREAAPGPADELAARHGAAVERIDAHAFAEQVKAAEHKAEHEDEERPGQG
ncbi:histidine kinase [Kitasatospora aureofaciens]|uniref:histidine kinase n=1 Tax=Kitasatospora aureofaciens TaxID=1894 RepID=UPI001C46F80F|nr:histidine kinase [Kitasatospora aureofaciens]MBV6695779.1 histidine kinase [Kitasatospora aureofaciens]